MIMTERLRGIVPIAIISLAVYAFLLILLFSNQGSWVGIVIIAVLSIVAYLIFGMVVSLSLIRRVRWSWNWAMIMWTLECIIFLIIAMGEVRALGWQLTDYMFVFFAILRIVSIAYFLRTKVRESFDL